MSLQKQLDEVKPDETLINLFMRKGFNEQDVQKATLPELRAMIGQTIGMQASCVTKHEVSAVAESNLIGGDYPVADGTPWEPGSYRMELLMDGDYPSLEGSVISGDEIMVEGGGDPLRSHVLAQYRAVESAVAKVSERLRAMGKIA